MATAYVLKTIWFTKAKPAHKYVGKDALSES